MTSVNTPVEHNDTLGLLIDKSRIERSLTNKQSPLASKGLMIDPDNWNFPGIIKRNDYTMSTIQSKIMSPQQQSGMKGSKLKMD